MPCCRASNFGCLRFPRFVLADELLGASVEPVRGLAPGCPAAIDWLALVMLGWRHRVEERLHGAVPHDFVDDSVARVHGGVRRWNYVHAIPRVCGAGLAAAGGG